MRFAFALLLLSFLVSRAHAYPLSACERVARFCEAPRWRHRCTVAGTLFGGDKPRLVAVEGIPLEAELSGNVLFVRNYDKPGFIGALGHTLGAAAVNIATFHLGRTAPGEDAIALVEVDQPLTSALLDQVLLDQVQALSNVIQIKALRF